MILPLTGCEIVHDAIDILRRIRNRFRTPVKIPPDNERVVMVLPSNGETISVEMALNSRCTSDYDEDPKNFHWGMFDRRKKLSREQIKRIIDLAKPPRFTSKRIEIKADGNMLTCAVDNNISGIKRDWVMVESGMQQQAIGLVCAALSVGMVFKNLGKNGTSLSESEYGTVKIRLDAMKPSYSDEFWTSSYPAGRKAWCKGNLPNPVRNSDRPLLTTLSHLNIHNHDGKTSAEHTISQLLWAARGRTPHFYKSRPWGMTIPTWAGEQHISSLYLISDQKLFRYVNWHRNRPTHSLEAVGEIDIDLHNELVKLFPLSNCLIVLGKNETFARALWEIGYQLLNLLLQAHAVDVAYQAALLDKTHKEIFHGIDINSPVAVVALRTNDGNKKRD